jgi:hypothetical protein
MWQLIKVTDTKWIQDDSGYYTLINWIDNNNVRLDVMDKDDVPVMSFQGAASDVRKCSMRYAIAFMLDGFISFEHAAYIGSELARCELLKKDYVQD